MKRKHVQKTTTSICHTPFCRQNTKKKKKKKIHTRISIYISREWFSFSVSVTLLFHHRHLYHHQQSDTMDLHHLITTRLFNQRRNNFYADKPPNIPPIELSIPPSTLFNPEALSTGLSLLNMSINSDIFLNNLPNSKQFVGQSIAQIINSILDDETINSVFDSLSDETKLKIMDLYLSDNYLVQQIKYNHNLQLKEHATINNTHDAPPPFAHLLYTLLHALYTFSILLYQKFAIPILTSLWQYLLTLNEQYNLMDMMLSQLINVLSIMIQLILKLVVHCTNLIESQNNPIKH